MRAELRAAELTAALALTTGNSDKAVCEQGANSIKVACVCQVFQVGTSENGTHSSRARDAFARGECQLTDFDVRAASSHLQLSHSSYI